MFVAATKLKGEEMKRTTQKTKKATRPTHKTSSRKLTIDMSKAEPIWDDDNKYYRLIDSFNIEAKWKRILKDIVSQTIVVAKHTIEIGKKIIEFIATQLKKYPRTAAAVVIGTLLTMIAGSIPVLGHLLAPLLMTLTVVISGGIFVSEALQQNIADLFGWLAPAK